MRLTAPILLALALAACAQQAPVPPGPPEVLANRLPSVAAGMERGTVVTLEQPGPGREVPYATPRQGRREGAAAIVQIWQPAGAPPADGTESAVARDAFTQAVREAEESAPHRRLAARGQFTLPAGSDPLLRCAEMQGRYARQPMTGLICAGAAGGGLVRLRMVMPQRNPPLADARAFASDIATALRQPH